MYKNNLVSFELPNSKLVEELKSEYKRATDPETLAQVKQARKFFSDNKENFDYLKEMYEQLRSELTIFFPKEISHPRELTEVQLEKEYKSFKKTETYTELSETIEKLPIIANELSKENLIRLVVILVFFSSLDLNTPKNLLEIFNVLFNFFKTTPEYIVVLNNIKNFYDLLDFALNIMVKNKNKIYL